MKQRKTFWLTVTTVVYAYALTKYSMLDLGGKFSEGILDNIIVSLVYFSPLLLFILSTYTLLRPVSRSRNVDYARLLFSALVSIAAIKAVYNFYIDLNLWAGYFEGLNSGYFAPKSQDFRLEYFIAFAFNCCVLLYFVDNRIQKWFGRTSKE